MLKLVQVLMNQKGPDKETTLIRHTHITATSTALLLAYIELQQTRSEHMHNIVIAYVNAKGPMILLKFVDDGAEYFCCGALLNN